MMKKCLLALALSLFLFECAWAADPVTITSQQLVKEYSANELAADKKYKGKTIIVTGKVDEVARDLEGEVYVSLETPDIIDAFGNLNEDAELFESVQCYFDDTDGLENLVKGQSVAIKGECEGRELINVILTDCELVN